MDSATTDLGDMPISATTSTRPLRTRPRQYHVPPQAWRTLDSQILAHAPHWLHGERLLFFLLEHDLSDIVAVQQAGGRERAFARLSQTKKRALMERAKAGGVKYKVALDAYAKARKGYRGLRERGMGKMSAVAWVLGEKGWDEAKEMVEMWGGDGLPDGEQVEAKRVGKMIAVDLAEHEAKNGARSLVECQVGDEVGKRQRRQMVPTSDAVDTGGEEERRGWTAPEGYTPAVTHGRSFSGVHAAKRDMVDVREQALEILIAHEVARWVRLN